MNPQISLHADELCILLGRQHVEVYALQKEIFGLKTELAQAQQALVEALQLKSAQAASTDAQG